MSRPDRAPQLFDEPYLFDFFQAVRLLEAAAPEGAEPVRYAARAGLGFPASDIHDLTPGRGDGDPPRMTVNFFGLTGPSGSLPSYFSEAILEDGDGALGAFLEIFDHRLLTLFYRAWERNHPQAAVSPRARQRFQEYLLALAGLLHDPSLASRATAYLPYAGLFADRRRSAAGLRGLLSDLLNGDRSPLERPREPIPVEILQNIPRYLQLPPETRPRLGAAGIGPSTIIGNRVRDHLGKFRVEIGPVDLDVYEALLPESTGFAHRLIVDTVRDYVGPSLSFDIRFVVNRETIPPVRLSRKRPSRLSRTWLASGSGNLPLTIIIKP